ncbi:uncharacterized protein EI90DRAFT_3083945 [Cantharellus anzutake]|uniref:uncharacterized protein n=1 Tax=Cantharellus anzutake TaxID=1750568 RepID=UPI001903F0BE|nr:uncharacterized protein EI90DRAFT_3083945 [Cantharellus anzutake]KAF8318281.1 hypothetical protein EI90DRAFT_3083945 [Cantharellus anzutake]
MIELWFNGIFGYGNGLGFTKALVIIKIRVQIKDVINCSTKILIIGVQIQVGGFIGYLTKVIFIGARV